MNLNHVDGLVERKRVFVGRYTEAMNVAGALGATCLATERNGEKYQPYEVKAVKVDGLGLFMLVNRYDKCVWEQPAEVATLDVIAEVVLLILEEDKRNRFFTTEEVEDFLCYARARREKEELGEVAAEGVKTKRRRI